MTLIALLVLAVCGFCGVLVRRILKSRNADIWIGSYVAFVIRRAFLKRPRPVHIHFCFVDHFEPFWKGASRERALGRVREWTTRYPALALRHKDSGGRPPVHTIFYPAEQYDPGVIDEIAALVRQGIADVEVHLHHDGDTPENFTKTVNEFVTALRERHTLLRTDPRTGRVVYGFIHGDWALGNSRKDGRYCGIPDELGLLSRTGCYADFTLPSAPSETQTRKINAIYFARDRGVVPKPHDTGDNARVGAWSDKDLLIVQGPLALNWRSRKVGVLPRIENGEVTADNPANDHRIDLWVRNAPEVTGAPDHVFIKVHTHGAEDANIESLLGWNMEQIWDSLERRYNDGRRYLLHYESAYEIYKNIKLLSIGASSWK